MISVIIPMFNAENTIIQTLRGLETQTINEFEIVVVDDGSSDNSSELVSRFQNQSKLQIKLVKQNNTGPAKARNVGASQSVGNIIVFLDSDCVPPANWLEEMVKPLDGKIVGCNCGYKVKNEENLIARYIDYEIAKRHEKLMGKNVDTIGSYSASFFKDIFIKVNGFNVEYPVASGEDFDLAFNLINRGYNLFFTDKTFVYHYHPGSLRKYLKQQYGRGYWRVKLYLSNKKRILSGDSYTGFEAQIQFILSSIALLSILMAIINPLFLSSFIILLFSNISIGLWMFEKENKFIIIGPIFASARSLAGTLGAFSYFAKYILINSMKVMGE